MKKWFLIYCKLGKERLAEINLKQQNFEVYRPTITRKISRLGQKQISRIESLFPRYIFVHVDPEVQSIRPIPSTYGVSSFVKFGARYATASQELIEEIKMLVDAEALSIETMDGFKKGDRILVDGYGFDQVKAIFCSPCGDQRALILMSIMGRESQLVVPIASVTRIAVVN